ncbi:MAG: glycoside hydrolase family 13 domain protein [Pedosphaera sp.]|nr:glycoside hydrolase family 13 domain protein [Pedosphaera sp.]
MYRPKSPFQAINQPDRYSAKKMAKPVNFICVAPAARTVFLMGDFNDWDTASHPMIRQPDGGWLIQVPLTHGHHHYQFLVDGKPMLDPRAQGVARNEKDEKVSLLAVS